MNLANRSSWIYAALFTLAACGGGASLDGDGNTGGGGSGGGATATHSITTAVYSCENVNQDSLDGCTATTNISATAPGLVVATLSSSSGSIDRQVVTFSTDKGSLSPSDGKALTNSSGQAFVRVLAGSADGIATLSASYSPASGTAISDAEVVTINQVDVDIALESSLGSDELADGATLALTATVTSDGQPLSTSADVEFSSLCAEDDKAALDAVVPVNTTSGKAIATYSPKGCTQQDTITAKVTIGGKSATDLLTIKIADAATGAISFDSASPNYICLDGSGCPSVSEVSFIVKDENDRPKQGVDVSFQLLTTAGGVSLSVNSARSDVNGVVRTRVKSGTVPGSARVQATVIADTGPLISTVSSALSIGTGLPDSNSFSLSLSEFNPAAAATTDGIQVDVTVRAADHFNNPVPDGTAVSFITEGGAIEPRCVTTNGACSVKWTSQDPRPDDMRVSVMAFMQGEESFTDTNGNGTYDSGEFFIDRNLNGVFDASLDHVPDYPEAFLDANEDSARNATEEFIDRNSDGLYTAADGKYNGTLCRLAQAVSLPNPPGAACEVIDTSSASSLRDGLVDLFSRGVIVLTGGGTIKMFVCDDEACTTPATSITLSSATDIEVVDLCIFEEREILNGTATVSNPMAIGTTVEYSASSPLKIEGGSSEQQPNSNALINSVGGIVQPDRDVSISGCPDDSRFDFAVTGATTGNVTVKVSLPDGSIVSFILPIGS